MGSIAREETQTTQVRRLQDQVRRLQTRKPKVPPIGTPEWVDVTSEFGAYDWIPNNNDYVAMAVVNGIVFLKGSIICTANAGTFALNLPVDFAPLGPPLSLSEARIFTFVTSNESGSSLGGWTGSMNARGYPTSGTITETRLQLQGRLERAGTDGPFTIPSGTVVNLDGLCYPL